MEPTIELGEELECMAITSIGPDFGKSALLIIDMQMRSPYRWLACAQSKSAA